MTTRISRNTLLAFTAQAIPMVAAIGSVPMLVRYLGSERVGLLSMIWVLISYFSALDIGISSAVTRSASMALADGRTASLGPVLWSAIAIQVSMGTVGSIVLIAAAPVIAGKVFNIPPELTAECVAAIRFCALGLPVVLLSGSVTGILQAASRFSILTKVQAPVGAAQYVIPTILAWQGSKLPVIVLVLVLLRVGALALTSYSVLRLFPDLLRHARFQVSEVKGLLSFGVWIMMSAVVSPLLVYVDRFLIANRLTLADVAYYSVPLDAVMRLLLFSSSLTSVLYPTFSSMSCDRDRERRDQVIRASLRYVLCCTAVPGFLIWSFSYDLMRFWITPEFATRSAPVLRILIFGVLANAVSRVPFSLLQSHGYPNITALIQIASLPLQVLASLYLMTLVGIRGAAAAWSVRLLVETACLFYFASRVCHLCLKQAWAENKSTIWTLTSVFGAGAMLGVLAGPGFAVRLVLFIILAASAALLLWCYALTSRDRTLIRNGLKFGAA